MKKTIISLLLIVSYMYSECISIETRNDVTKTNCEKASACLRDESILLKDDLVELKLITEELEKDLNITLREAARCYVYAEAYNKDKTITRWKKLNIRCEKFYNGFSKKLKTVELNFDEISTTRRNKLEETIKAVEADLEFTKRQCGIKK